MLNVAALAVQCGLFADREVLAAIVRVESRGNPYALAVNGDVELERNPRNRGEAVVMAHWLQDHGYNFDAGLAQVNSANLARLGLDVVSVFDPCSNLRAASRVLRECHDRAMARLGRGDQAVAAALSCYNTGDFARGVRSGYVAAVRSNVSSPPAIHAPGRRRAGAATSEKRVKRERRIGLGNRRPEARTPRADVFAESLADVFDDARRAGSRMRVRAESRPWEPVR
jgi:type IV secretion system protein VirB1